MSSHGISTVHVCLEHEDITIGPLLRTSTARKVPVSKSSQAWKLYDFKECTSWEMYKRAQGLKPCAC